MTPALTLVAGSPAGVARVAGGRAAIEDDLLDFELPPSLEAHEPPEARGLARDGVRLLVAQGERVTHSVAGLLPEYLEPGDLLVVNLSATLAAAVPGWRKRDEQPIAVHFSGPHPGGGWVVELRSLVGSRPGLDLPGVFGSHRRLGLPGVLGSHRRLGLPGVLGSFRGVEAAAGPTAPFVAARPGDVVWLPGGSRLRLVAPEAAGAKPGPARLWRVDLELPGVHAVCGEADDHLTDTMARVGGWLARHGAPIRYAHVPRGWPLADYQTVFARVMGSAEMPSAGRPFTPALVTALVLRGVGLAPVVLHAGVSSQEAGEGPLTEHFSVPATTAERVNDARRRGHRVVAVGTTVVRALESAVDSGGTVRARDGWTDLVVTAGRGVAAVDGLVTGWHEPRASHLAMLEAVAGRPALEVSYRAALQEGYRWHEFGDWHLILPG